MNVVFFSILIDLKTLSRYSSTVLSFFLTEIAVEIQNLYGTRGLCPGYNLSKLQKICDENLLKSAKAYEENLSRKSVSTFKSSLVGDEENL